MEKKEMDDGPAVGMQSRALRSLAQRIRVPAGFVLAPLLLITARPTAASLLGGGALAVVGLAIRAWASGYLKKNQELATRGPYAHTRNPLYLGTFLLGTGVAVGGGVLWFVLLFIAVYLLIYVPVMLAEAEMLCKLFADDYLSYSEQVPLFMPRLTPYRSSESSPVEGQELENRFDLSLYLRHREYRAAIGTLIVFALLAGKLLLSS